MTEPIPVVFVLTSLLVILTPGQDMLLVMSRSVAQGGKAGVATAAGVSTGLLGHTLLAALGLGALLKASLVLFTAVKLAGAAYLIYLGGKMFCARANALALQGLACAPLRRLYFQGAVSNLANPKIAVFYLAFLPQFVPQGTVHATGTLLMLGTAFALLTFLIKGPIGLGAGALSGWLRRRPAVLRTVNRLSGTVLIALGLKLALARRV
jgi:threonine/homoserine/homoserine lactone efflux protein